MCWIKSETLEIGPSKCCCLFTVYSQWHMCLPDTFSSPSEKATPPSHPSLLPSSFSMVYTLDFLEEVSSDLTFLYPSGPLIRMVFHPHCQNILLWHCQQHGGVVLRMEASSASDRDFLRAEALLVLTVSVGPDRKLNCENCPSSSRHKRNRYLLGQLLRQGPTFHSRVSAGQRRKQSTLFKRWGEVSSDLLLLISYCFESWASALKTVGITRNLW